MKSHARFTLTASIALVSGLCGYTGPGSAASLNLADSPLFLSLAVKPNLILSVDDSGSMDSEVLLPTNDGALWWNTNDKRFVGRGNQDNVAPGVINFNKDGTADSTWKKFTYLFPNGIGLGQRVYDDSDHSHYAIPPLPQFAYTRSPTYNKAYFDPKVVYESWIGYGSTTFGNIDPRSAPSDPVRGSATFNLTTEIQSASVNSVFKMYPGMTIPTGTYYQDWKDSKWKLAAADKPLDKERDVPIRYFPATFYLPSGELPADFGYTGPTTNDRAPDGSTVLLGYEIKPGNFADANKYKSAIQNFANWFTYYRKRHAAVRGAIGRAFDELLGIRVGSFRINNRVNVIMRDFDVSSEKDALYAEVYNNYVGSGGTPNREALKHAGDQFMRTDTGAPITLSCQQNFALAFTDGFSTAWTGAGVGNADGDDGAPYADSASNTIADIAMHYYQTNLRPTLNPGMVQTPAECNAAKPDPHLDCNSNPHMVTFGITLGTKGEIFDVDMAATNDPYANPPAWPTLFPDRHPSAIDDLWHATINGRGQFLNANTPKEVADKLDTENPT
jgi:hypothetical protein